MERVHVSCFLLSYLVAFGFELFRLLRRTLVGRGVMLGFGWAGLVAHSAYLVTRSRHAELPPLLSSSQDWMLVLAWLAVVIYLVAATWKRDLAIGVFLLPIVLVLIAAAVFVSPERSALLADRTNYRLIMLHASLIVIGIAGVLVGIVLSLMYLFQHRRLKSKQSSRTGLWLPSLERLARWNWWSVVLAVPTLTGGFLSGVILGQRTLRDGRHMFTFTDPLVVGTGVAWLVMMLLFVWLIRTPRHGGRDVAWLTLWAFGFLLVTTVGLQLLTDRGVFQTFHSADAVGSRNSTGHEPGPGPDIQTMPPGV